MTSGHHMATLNTSREIAQINTTQNNTWNSIGNNLAARGKYIITCEIRRKKHHSYSCKSPHKLQILAAKEIVFLLISRLTIVPFRAALQGIRKSRVFKKKCYHCIWNIKIKFCRKKIIIPVLYVCKEERNSTLTL